MKRALLILAGVGEAATGMVLVAHPPIVVWLLLGANVAGARIVMGRIAGLQSAFDKAPDGRPSERGT